MNDTSLANGAPANPSAIGAVLHSHSRPPLLIYALSLGLIVTLSFALRSSMGGTSGKGSQFAGAYPSSDNTSYPIGDDHWSDAGTAKMVVSQWLSDAPTAPTLTISRQNVVWVRDLVASAARQAKASHANPTPRAEPPSVNNQEP